MTSREVSGRTGECLRDAHMHLAQLGRSVTMLDVRGSETREACLGLIAARAAESSDGWLLALGMRAEAWVDASPPTARELDEASGGRACCVWSFDHHALCASTEAMRLAGVLGMESDPKGGVVVRDDQGAPTGVLLERAAHLVWDAVPEPTAGERLEQVRSACKLMLGLGFGEVHELLAPAWLGPLLAELSDRGELGLHVELFAPVDEIEHAAEAARSWSRDNVRLGGGKVFLDGTLNSRTAWMLEPYADSLPSHPCGTPMMSDEEIDAAILRCAALGLPVAAHAIGDAAVRAGLDAAERTRAERFRIEHAEIIDPADIGRFAELGVICSPQPCHLLPDMEVLSRLLPHRLDRVLPLRELIDSGLELGRTLIFGSDAPIVRADPADSVLAAVRRGRVDVADPIGISQALDETEAWQGFVSRR